ncbi:MAG: hypothetical protein DMF77_04240 [Acidobacteria bacterium]|nr:MAG: hypothetical protein DMF77_04240 [Acidobacteriota bacterium]
MWTRWLTTLTTILGLVVAQPRAHQSPAGLRGAYERVTNTRLVERPPITETLERRALPLA